MTPNQHSQGGDQPTKQPGHRKKASRPLGESVHRLAQQLFLEVGHIHQTAEQQAQPTLRRMTGRFRIKAGE